MEDSEKCCRLCSKLMDHTHLQNLFDRCNRKILTQVEEIIGVKLKNTNNLPESYCNSCEMDLEQAYQFRERVLEAQKLFHEEYYKEEKHSNNVEFVELEPVLTEVSDFESQMIIEQTTENTEEDLFDLEDDGVVEEHEEHYSNVEYEDAIEEKRDIIDDEEYVEYKPISTNEYETEIIVEETIVKDDFTMDKLEEFEDLNENETKPTDKSKTPKTKRKKEKSAPIQLICDQCGNYFTSRHNFLTHLRRHAGDKQFQCELCADKFFTNSELNRHMRRHTGERPFACRYCDRNFTDYSTRMKHERTHTNERPFSCNRCEKSFTTSYILKNHMLTHTGERSFRCNLCNKAFQRQTNLATHYRSISHQQNEIKQMSVETAKQPEINNSDLLST